MTREDTFCEYVAEHHNMLRGLAVNITDYQTAEDVLQTALTGAWKAYVNGFEPNNPRAWLAKCVHNTAINVYKERKRKPQIQLADDTYAQDRTGDPFTIVSSREEADELLEAIADLPERQRQVLMDTTTGGLSFRQAGERMNIKEGAARQLQFRARTTLRERLT